MDFVPGSGKLQTYPANIPLPFYMTYPGYFRREQEDEIVRDLEYLQDTYPGEVKKMRRKIAEILDKVDYEGSMIYDEYPDKFSVMHLAETIDKLLQEKEGDMGQALVHVLVGQEIYKRRHGGRRGSFRF